MNAFRKSVLNVKLHEAYRQLVHTGIKSKKQVEWLKPVGYETDILIYNSITKTNVPLILRNKNVLTWYVCGPTVYDSAHIGHAITYVNTDIIRRILLEYFNINVAMVMCITDIDDKVIAQAAMRGQDYKSLTQEYEKEFMEDMRMLNVLKPLMHCRVTDYVPQIIQFVQRIVKKGNAYVTEDGSVYFDTDKYGRYGKLIHLPLNDKDSSGRSTKDFCLWKAAKKNEPCWESPWGYGRPGWHIECSTIASTVFGNSIDIHSGGIDLLFPHHENEEAQSCSYHDVKQWVNYWLHFGHLCVENEKMSKSLKNTISIRELLKKYTANQFRMLCLLSNYRTGLKFSDELMRIAVDTLDKIEHFTCNCSDYIQGKETIANVDQSALFQCLEETKRNVHIALTDDFNTAQATRSLLNLVDVTNKMLHNSQGIKNTLSNGVPAIGAVSNYITTIFSKFGIGNSTVADDCRMNDIVEHFVKFRNVVRSRCLEDAKDKVILAACDTARLNLASCGVIIKDQKTTTTWSIKKY